MQWNEGSTAFKQYSGMFYKILKLFKVIYRIQKINYHPQDSAEFNPSRW